MYLDQHLQLANKPSSVGLVKDRGDLNLGVDIPVVFCLLYLHLDILDPNHCQSATLS
jgi:hypothetical protein